MNKGFNSTFIHRVNVILHPFPQDQVQLQETPLFTPVQKPKISPHQINHLLHKINKHNPNPRKRNKISKHDSISHCCQNQQPVEQAPLAFFIGEIDIH